MLSENIERITINDLIEKLREKMHMLAASNGLSHPRVLEVSQLLDREISNYYRRQANC